MRTAILSSHEREIIRRFMEEKERLNGINTLRFRIREHLPQIEEDLELIKRFMEAS